MATEDLPQVRKLGEQLGYPSSESEMAQRWAAIQSDANYALFVARTSEGRVLGWIQVNREAKSLLVEPFADVGALVVDQGCRSQGVGRALLAAGENWVRSQGLTCVRVRSNVLREQAHRFYLREGYPLAKTSRVFLKNLS